MKFITLFTMILVSLFSIITSGQNKIYYHKNTFERTFTKCQNSPTFGTDSLALQQYLTEKLQDKISQTKGQVKISVLIDTTGKPSCEWIENNANFKLNKDNLNLVIDSMPNWNFGV